MTTDMEKSAPMTILTDDLIEKGAMAGYLHDAKTGHIAWRDLPQSVKDFWIGYARACLEAALPDLVEACAKVAKGKCVFDENPYCEGRCDAANAVLALIPHSISEGK